MSDCLHFGARLDFDWLEVAWSVPVVSAGTPDIDLPTLSGAELAHILNGRFLIRYLLERQLGTFLSGSAEHCYVTPTPYSSEECIGYLSLPEPLMRREHALLIRPDKLVEVIGPRRVRLGGGIEFILPGGLPQGCGRVGVGAKNPLVACARCRCGCSSRAIRDVSRGD